MPAEKVSSPLSRAAIADQGQGAEPQADCQL
jgi:hypothetical protein